MRLATCTSTEHEPITNTSAEPMVAFRYRSLGRADIAVRQRLNRRRLARPQAPAERAMPERFNVAADTPSSRHAA